MHPFFGVIFLCACYYVFYKKFIPQELKALFQINLLVFLVLLLASSALNKKYGENYPAVFEDGRRYHELGKAYSESPTMIPDLNYLKTMVVASALHKKGLLQRTSDWKLQRTGGSLSPGWSILIVGMFYRFLGVSHLNIKILNILFFQIAGLLLYKTLVFIQSINPMKFLKIFLFFIPTGIVYSLSLLKEVYLIFLLMSAIYIIIVRKNLLVFTFIIAVIFFTRPYYAVILSMSYILTNYKKILEIGVYKLIPAIVLLTALPFALKLSTYNIIYLLTNHQFALHFGRKDVLWFSGIEFLTFAVTHPFLIIKPFFYGIITTLMRPTFWNIPQSSIAFNKALGAWSHTLLGFSWYYLLALIFPYGFLLLKNREIIRFSLKDFFVICFLLTAFVIGLSGESLRYKFTIFPVFMLMIANFQTKFPISNPIRLKYSVLFAVFVVMLMFFDIVFWGRSSLL